MRAGPLLWAVSPGAGVVELADALDSKSSVPLERVGSSPTSGTTHLTKTPALGL